MSKRKGDSDKEDGGEQKRPRVEGNNSPAYYIDSSSDSPITPPRTPSDAPIVPSEDELNDSLDLCPLLSDDRRYATVFRHCHFCNTEHNCLVTGDSPIYPGWCEHCNINHVFRFGKDWPCDLKIRFAALEENCRLWGEHQVDLADLTDECYDYGNYCRNILRRPLLHDKVEGKYIDHVYDCWAKMEDMKHKLNLYIQTSKIHMDTIEATNYIYCGLCKEGVCKFCNYVATYTRSMRLINLSKGLHNPEEVVAFLKATTEIFDKWHF